MYKSLLFLILMSCAVHTNADNREKREVLASLLDEIYPDVAVWNDSTKESKEHLKKQLTELFPDCPLSTQITEEPSAFLDAVSCHKLIDSAGSSPEGLTRFQVNRIILELGETNKIDEARQETLLASLDQIYEPESARKVEERAQLINHLQNCEQDYGVMDTLKFWSEAFGCKGIIETAKKGEIAYVDIQDAIDAALPDKTTASAKAAADVVSPSDKPKKRRKTSKP